MGLCSVKAQQQLYLLSLPTTLPVGKGPPVPTE